MHMHILNTLLGAQTSPQNGPARFYGSDQANLPYPTTPHSPDFRKHTPVSTRPLQQQPPVTSGAPAHYAPQKTYDHPQELGTSAYDSPQETAQPNMRHSYHPSINHQQPLQQHPHLQQTGGFSQAGPTSDSNLRPSYPPPSSGQQEEQQQAPQSQYPPPQASTTPGQPAQPMHQPPSIPSSTSQPLPYPAHTSPHAPAPSAPGANVYQAYQPPPIHQQGSPTTSANPASFYR